MKTHDALKEKILRWRRELHRIPEFGLHLPKTSAYLKKELEALGVDYKEYISGNGLAASIGQGKTYALRVDMDALPILEETGLDFSADGLGMHACGHDAHMSLGLACCAYFKSIEEEMNFRFVCIFQPGEEHPGGALPMIQEGVLEDFNIQAILGCHLGNLAELEPGTLSVKSGPIMAAGDYFSLRIKGKGSHGAFPNRGVDTILLASLIVSQLQYIISRELDPREDGVISFGKISGGTSFNVIPEEIFLEGTVRTLSEDTRRFVAGRIEELSTSIARSYGGEAYLSYDFRYPVVVNDEKMTEFLLDEAREYFGEDRVVNLHSGTMAGEDIAFFLQKVPGVYFFFSNQKEVEGSTYPHHHPKFDLDEAYLSEVVAFLVHLFETLGR